MTTEDDEFLKQYNSTKKTVASQLSEDDFERIMEVFEEMASEQTPFASIDNTVVSYETMLPQISQLGTQKLMAHSKNVYEHWKSRRQATGNKPLHPSVKFETHQESDEADPYVCFRRREARQTRKTRQRDVQSAEKLKRLRKELEDGRQLIIHSYEREMLKREVLNLDRIIFEQRARLKEMKVKLGIKTEDDDLINQKVCRALFASGWMLTACSLRRRSQWKLLRCRDLQATICASLCGRTVVPWKQTLCNFQTSSQRRRTSCGRMLRARFTTTGSGTRTMWISPEILYLRSRNRAWKSTSGPPRPNI